MALKDVEFETMKGAGAGELAEFYRRQGHRITEEPKKLRRMIDATACFVTARRGGTLIGIARGLTDGVWGCLAECKLDPSCQGPACVTHTDGRIEHDTSGIAREMARRVIEYLRDYGCERIDALAYGTELDFCEELGFRKITGVTAVELDLRAAEARPVGVATGAAAAP